MINSFGLLNMFQGIAVMIGPPIAGLLYDISKSYASSCVFAGRDQILKPSGQSGWPGCGAWRGAAEITIGFVEPALGYSRI